MDTSRFHVTKVSIVLYGLLPISFVGALVYGAIDLPWLTVLQSLMRLTDIDGSQTDLIVQNIRLPRALLAAFVGALLAISGAVMQGLFRNPLADPSLIGVTAGASVGASLTIIFAGAGSGFFGLSVVSIGALIGGALSVWLVYKLATTANGTSVATMLLGGIAIASLAGALISLLEFYSTNEMLRRISLWRMGGLDGADGFRVILSAIVATVTIAFLMRQATVLNALLLGESEARHLGIDIDRLKYKLILTVAAGVGVSVALAGPIGFVGLVVPHMVRMAIGPDHRYLLPLSAVGGAVLLLVADTVARVAVAPTELPVGLVTTLVGAPFFISLLRHRSDYSV